MECRLTPCPWIWGRCWCSSFDISSSEYGTCSCFLSELVMCVFLCHRSLLSVLLSPTLKWALTYQTFIDLTLWQLHFCLGVDGGCDWLSTVQVTLAPNSGKLVNYTIDFKWISSTDFDTHTSSSLGQECKSVISWQSPLEKFQHQHSSALSNIK